MSFHALVYEHFLAENGSIVQGRRAYGFKDHDHDSKVSETRHQVLSRKYFQLILLHYEKLEELGRLRRELKYQEGAHEKCTRSSRTMRKSGSQNAFRVHARPSAMVCSASSTFYRAVLSKFEASTEGSDFPLPRRKQVVLRASIFDSRDIDTSFSLLLVLENLTLLRCYTSKW